MSLSRFASLLHRLKLSMKWNRTCVPVREKKKKTMEVRYQNVFIADFRLKKMNLSYKIEMSYYLTVS